MSDDNRSPSPGLNPWLASPRTYENETVSMASSAGEGTTRDVVLSQVVEEPSKGTNPPRREIRTLMNGPDALTLAVHLAENGHAVERLNAQEGHNRKRKPFFSHRSGDPGRRMNRDFARTNERLAAVVLAQLRLWQNQHSNEADYRVTGAIQSLATAVRLIGELVEDTTPELDIARRHLHRIGFFAGEAYQPITEGELVDVAEANAKLAHEGFTPESAGVLTGHGPTDRHEGKVPRLLAEGSYYVTAAHHVPVQVKSVGTENIQLTVLGHDASDYPRGIQAPRHEAGTWLVLDDASDWLDPDGESTKTDD